MVDAGDAIKLRYEALLPVLDEQSERRFAGAEALAVGYGGVSLVARVTGIARSTINRGIEEIKAKRDAGCGRVRKAGGGRKSKVSENPKLLDDLKTLVEPDTRGVYDITHNVGWVSVGVTSDTATFAVNTIRRWWQTMGCEAYASAGRLLITADGGGSNGTRVRLWKIELEKLATEIGKPISVCHLPPGTSRGVGRRDCTFGLSQNGA